MRPRSTPRVLPTQTDLGFAPLSPTQRPTAASGPSSNIPMIPTATLETMCASAARRTATPAPIATMALVAAVPTLCPTIIAQASTRSAIAVAGSLRPGNPARQKVRQPAHRARVLEVRIQSPPAASLLRINSAADRRLSGERCRRFPRQPNAPYPRTHRTSRPLCPPALGCDPTELYAPLWSCHKASPIGFGAGKTRSGA